MSIVSRDSFITGSRAYGEPREDSDIDLVVMVDQYAFDILKGCTTETLDDDPDYGNMALSVRFGNLNLIAVTDKSLFDVWRKGTDTLIKRGIDEHRPIPREEAVELLSAMRNEFYEFYESLGA